MLDAIEIPLFEVQGPGYAERDNDDPLPAEKTPRSFSQGLSCESPISQDELGGEGREPRKLWLDKRTAHAQRGRTRTSSGIRGPEEDV